MKKGYKKIFWGFIFMTFHINIGRVPIIPNFISYIIIYCGIKNIVENYNLRSFKIASNFCIGLAVLSFFSLIIEVQPNGIIENNIFFKIIWMNVFGILEMIMVYMLLCGNMEILKEMRNCLHERYYKKIIKYVILKSMSVVAKNINMIFMSKTLLGLTVILELGIRIWIILLIRGMYKFSLKNEYGDN